MVVVKEYEKPKFCTRCAFSKLFGVILDKDNPSKNKKYVRCDITKKSYPEYNLMLRDDCPAPDDCPIKEVEPYGPEGTLYKEK